MEDIIDLSTNIDDDDCVVLESVIYNNNCINNYDKMKKEEPLFTELLEQCLKLENSADMLNIINELLITKYKDADKNWKESSEFRNKLRETINLLKRDPCNMYKYMKHFENVLHTKPNRRVQLITLESKDEKGNKYVSKVPIINSSVPSNNTENKNEEKENKVLNTETNSTTSYDKPKRLVFESTNEYDREDPLLVPHRVIDLDSSKSEKIKEIKKEIKFCKRVIEKLEKEDVCTDSVNSPYIKCEKLKAKIVKLYKELCQLNGDDPVKKKKIQLKVMQGHPAGPVKRLEIFLNKNIKNGNPPFPNFRDVVKCVLIANNEDSLGWSKAQIMQEATALFTYCGRALQRRRQKKEYQDLISMVAEPEYDPADNDSELMAKLEANKQIAMSNEKEVFQRFSMMQNLPIQTKATKDVEMEIENSNSDSDCSLEEKSSINNNLSEDKVVKDLDVKIKKEPEMDIEDLLNGLGDNYTTTVIEEDSYIVIEIDSSDDE